MLAAILKINGTLSVNKQGLTITVRTENAKIASKIHKLLKYLYQPEISFVVSRKMKLKKNNVYILRISKAKGILEDLSLLSLTGIKDHPDKQLLAKECCKRAYLAGIFLACGSVNDPITPNYHLELSIHEESLAVFVQSIMQQFSLPAKMIKRRSRYVVYVKSSEKIGDFLRSIGASQSVLNFEGTRIDRTMSNTVNRWNNCDIANEVKTLTTANEQIENIHTIEMFAGLQVLDEKTHQVALLRLQYPECSLLELSTLYMNNTGQTISKSGLHRHLQKIKKEANRLRLMESEKYGKN